MGNIYSPVLYFSPVCNWLSSSNSSLDGHVHSSIIFEINGLVSTKLLTSNVDNEGTSK